MGKQNKEVSLGKSAIFLGVICVLASIAASASGAIFYGIIAVLTGILAVICAVLWGINREAKKRANASQAEQ